MPALIDAHRGECGIPGLPAAERYRRAISLGVEYVEIDVRRSADDVYVNYHDERTPSGRAVRELTFAALKQELGAELLKVDEAMELVDGSVGLHVDFKEIGDEAAALPGVAAILDGGTAPGGVASSVLDLTGPEPHVLREGAIPIAVLLGAPPPRAG